MSTVTQAMVDEALRIATEENGYSFEGMDAEQIAIDLCDYCPFPAAAEATLENVEPLVKNWMMRRRER